MLVCLHGFLDTWRTWELALPALERSFDVLAPTLAGHAGGPPIGGGVGDGLLADAVERAMDDAGFETAHLAGNSLGAFVALQLAVRGRARSVVAFAPAGGWAEESESFAQTLDLQAQLHELLQAVAPQADEIVSTPEGRRRVTEFTTTRFEHIPAELLAHQIVGAARCDARPLLEHARRRGFHLDAERIACPVRVVWGQAIWCSPWPSAAERFRNPWLPRADWIVLDDVGHCAQLDVPLEAAELIAGFASLRPDRLAPALTDLRPV